MSLNLCFDVKGGAGLVDFPFQTPTFLTYKVLNAPIEDRLSIIEKHIDTWDVDNEYKNSIVNSCKSLMDSPNLELSMI